jgi:hypothetical protein
LDVKYSIFHVPDSAWSELCFDPDFMTVLVHIWGNNERSKHPNHREPHREMGEMISRATSGSDVTTAERV